MEGWTWRIVHDAPCGAGHVLHIAPRHKQMTDDNSSEKEGDERLDKRNVVLESMA